MINNYNLTNKKILLLQSPIGPFFNRLSKKLEKGGAEVYKLNFNGGDFIFYPFNSTSYTGKLENFAKFLKIYCIKYSITNIFMFNDCRPVHAVAIEVAKKMDINVNVFEEGYIRPDYITFELNGVNANSLIPKNRSFYENLDDIKIADTKKVKNAFLFMSFYATIYWIFAFLLSFYYNNSLHHRSLSPKEVIPWIISFYRKYRFKITNKNIINKISKLEDRFFLVALQVHNDTQIGFHYNKKRVEEFIKDCIKSFANNSKNDHYLLIKHHPMDRGYKDYTKLIKVFSKRYKVFSRVFYIQDGHLPSLLSSSLGCVTINSTVGVSAMHHECPLKVCGDAFYDIDGLVYQGSLDDFWKESIKYRPDENLYKKFKSYVISKSQLNGSFYREI